MGEASPEMVNGNIICTTIDVEEVSIDHLVKCMMQYAQNVDRKHRFLSNLIRIGRFIAGNVIRRRDQQGSNPIK